MDRKRKKKTFQLKTRESPSDANAGDHELKDGRPALAYNAENAVDLRPCNRRGHQRIWRPAYRQRGIDSDWKPVFGGGVMWFRPNHRKATSSASLGVDD